MHEYERPLLLGFDARKAELEMQPKGGFRLLTPLLGPTTQRTMQKKQRGPRIKQAVESEPLRSRD